MNAPCYDLNQWGICLPLPDHLFQYPACPCPQDFDCKILMDPGIAVEKLRETLDTIKREREIFKMQNQLQPAENVLQHESICNELIALYAKKNADYGDAFHLSYLEEGIAMSRIRLGDKFNRFKNLSRVDPISPQGRKVKDESIRDTLIDLANYAIMTVMELDREVKERKEKEEKEYKEYKE